MTRHSFYQRGASVPLIITLVLLSLLVISFAGLAIYAYVNYEDQRSNVQARVDRAVAIAEKEQADSLETKFQSREKEPNKSFVGPSDYGSLGFKYPKTWSAYIAKDGTNDSGFEAYLNPGVVPPASEKTRYALRVTIVDEAYEKVIEEYRSQVEEGDLKSSATKANGQNGTRLEGNFSKDIRGIAVVYKIRDKTAVIRTDADTFRADYEALIKTISFNQ